MMYISKRLLQHPYNQFLKIINLVVGEVLLVLHKVLVDGVTPKQIVMGTITLALEDGATMLNLLFIMNQ